MLSSMCVSDGDKVSIFMAAFNAADYIDFAVESIIHQTYRNLELIIVDDSSSDSTLSILSKYSTDERIVVLRNNVNSGPSFSRNRAIKACSGAWLMQVDADDWIAPQRVEELLSFAKRTDADIVSDDQAFFIDGSKKIFSTRLLEAGVGTGERIVSRAMFVQRDLGSIKPMFKRELLARVDGYPLDIRYGEDFVFLFSLLSSGSKMALCSSPMYFLRRGDTGSLTRNRKALFDALLRGTDLMLLECQRAGDHEGERLLKLRRVHIQKLALGEGCGVGENLNTSLFFTSIIARVARGMSAVRRRLIRKIYLDQKVREAARFGFKESY